MPTYEFKCSVCGCELEKYFKSYDESLKEKCPKCDNLLDRKISKTSFILKSGGVGWSKEGYGGIK
jgi:putative FmdB family regulatory protein